MKKIISILTLLLSLIACKAQTYPLNTFFDDVPNYSYMKDLDNLLPPYVGTYKATFQDNEITLFIAKEDRKLIDHSGDKKNYQDVLNIKYIVKKMSTGVILQNTQNGSTIGNEIKSIGTYVFENNAIALIYSGTNCAVGNGSIKLIKPSANQISWSYYPDSSLLTEQNCPGNPDLKVYLPVTENLIFTKQ